MGSYMALPVTIKPFDSSCLKTPKVKSFLNNIKCNPMAENRRVGRDDSASDNVIQAEDELTRSRLSTQREPDTEPEVPHDKDLAREEKSVTRKLPLFVGVLNGIYFLLILISVFFAISYFFEYKNISADEDLTQVSSVELFKSVGCGILAVGLAIARAYMTEYYST